MTDVTSSGRSDGRDARRAIVVARLFVPLLIPRFPLVIVVVLVIDAVDQTLLATFTDVDTGDNGPYQSVDKALDVYYLSIAYLTTMRNWTSHPAFRIAQFLFYYRLVGVMPFELTDERPAADPVPEHVRVLLHRLRARPARYEPARFSGALLAARRRRPVGVRQAPTGVLDPRRAAGLHRRGARPPGVRRSRSSSRSSSPALVVVFVVIPRLPAPDWGWSWARTRCRPRWARRTHASPAAESGRVLTREAFEQVGAARAPVHHLRLDPAGDRRHGAPGRRRRHGDRARQRRDQSRGTARRGDSAARIRGAARRRTSSSSTSRTRCSASGATSTSATGSSSRS